MFGVYAGIDCRDRHWHPAEFEHEEFIQYHAPAEQQAQQRPKVRVVAMRVHGKMVFREEQLDGPEAEEAPGGWLGSGHVNFSRFR